MCLGYFQQAEENKAAERTRKLLIAASSEIFARVGYQAATTRQICCKAKVNPAAVNYHFGDKLGLYTAVLKECIKQEERRVGQHELLRLPPRQALGKFVTMMLEGVVGEGAQDCYTRIMAQELLQPTPRLALVVKRITGPRVLLLCEIVSRLTGQPAVSRKTRMCAHSVISQVVHYMHARDALTLLWSEWRIDATARCAIAAHITAFSLAGLEVYRAA